MNYQPYRPTSYNFLPPVVKNLLIINTLLWLAQTVFEEQLGFSFNERFGLYYPLSEHFIPVQYVTHLFLHGNFTHLFLNMFALWMFGSVLENYWGPKKFLTYFAITGLGAACIHTLSGWFELYQLGNVIRTYAEAPNTMDFLTLMKKSINYLPSDIIDEINTFFNQWEANPNDQYLMTQSIEYAKMLQRFKMDVPTVGASGAVFGLLLAFGMLFPNQIILFLFVIPMKAKFFVILYGIFELYSGISNNPGDNVAHFAHLGGMLFGYLLIKYWKNKQRNYYH